MRKTRNKNEGLIDDLYLQNSNAPFLFLVRIDRYRKKEKPAKDQQVLNRLALLFRGPERIRTAVGAFAELCLATRPQDPIYFRFQILHICPDIYRDESETGANISRLIKRL